MNIIVTADLNWGIGYKGRMLPTSRVCDSRLEKLVRCRPVIVGRETFESVFEAKPVFGQQTIVMSRDLDYHPKDVEVCHSVKDLNCKALQRAFVVGGAEIYGWLLHKCDMVFVTRVYRELTYVDKWFADLDKSLKWRLYEKSKVSICDNYAYQYLTYVRNRG